jgi:Na+-translocating ferredoxin:NAD+ oxidoreductase RnfD subunit
MTGLLTVVYAGLVLLAVQVVRFHTPVALIAGTLTAAVLFNLPRRRLQRAVNRRFHRPA